MQPGVIIVSNRLPVRVVRNTSGQLEYLAGDGGLARGLASYTRNKRNKWIGWPGIDSDSLTEKEKNAITRRLRRQNCYPVFLTKKQVDDYYNGYSNSILWPLVHEQAAGPEALRREKALFGAYAQVNQAFCDAVLRLGSPRNVVWVHDYQLMLVPGMLRLSRPDAKIGFFLHTPFPEGDKARLANGEELLSGLLGADLIGFHTTAYVENFLSAIQRYDIGTIAPRKVILPGRIVRATEFPIGIDYKKFASATNDKQVKAELEKLEEQYAGMKLIATVDRLDPSKGLVERVTAYQTLLRNTPKLHGSVIMRMLAIPSRTDIPAYKKLKKDLEALVKNVNKEFGTKTWQPIEYTYGTMDFAQLSALYQRADVGFIAPLRDGMNLVAKEYVASHPSHQGMLVLSKSAGAAQELKDAVMVSHDDPSSLVRGLSKALNMRPAELRRRSERMQSVLSTSTIQVWAGSFMNSLRLTGSEHTRALSVMTPNRRRRIAQSYQSARRRLILLDYDGTLAKIVDDPAAAAPSDKLKKLLVKLTADPKNTIILTSGRSRHELAEWLGDIPLTLFAEHGSFRRSAGHKNWRNLHRTGTPAWRDDIMPILDEYADRTPGAFVERKSTSLVWHYRNASPFYAQKNLVILQKLLKPLLVQRGLQMNNGNKVLEIRQRGSDKGSSMLPFLGNRPDFILAAGDDFTDEDMFAILPDSAVTIKVGRGRTLARFRAKDHDELRALLNRLMR